MAIQEDPSSRANKEAQLSKVEEGCKRLYLELEAWIGGLAPLIRLHANPKSYCGFYLRGDKGTFAKLELCPRNSRRPDAIKLHMSQPGPWHDPRQLLTERKDGAKWWFAYVTAGEDPNPYKELIRQAYEKRKASYPEAC